MNLVLAFYEESGVEMFDRASILQRFRYKFDDARLAALLQHELGAGTTRATVG